jgi:hypothetical protein
MLWRGITLYFIYINTSLHKGGAGVRIFELYALMSVDCEVFSPAT